MAVGPRLARDGLVVHWLGGGLYLELDGEGLLLDVPVTAAPALVELGALPRLRSVMLTSGRPRAVAGLVSLLCALEPHRSVDAPLTVRSCLGESRGVVLASAWSEAWPDRYPVLHDGVMPGGAFDEGPFEVTTMPVRHGEPRWSPRPLIEPAVGVAVRVAWRERAVAWVPGAAPGSPVRRACRGALLAVVEVAAEPWPASGEAWRMTVEDALREAVEADEVWVVGDDGRFGLPGRRDEQ